MCWKWWARDFKRSLRSEQSPVCCRNEERFLASLGMTNMLSALFGDLLFFGRRLKIG